MSIPLMTGSGSSMQQYRCANRCTWCDGCGDYGIWTAMQRALVELKIAPWQALLCYDVGCHGNMSDKLLGYRFHGLHGRVLPFAAGAKLANPRVPVLAFGGDGASFSEGVGHLVHAVRSNYPITFILHNNGNYGLTTGQASALTWQDQPMNAAPNGIPERTIHSMDFLFSLEPTFVARTFSGDIPHMTKMFAAAIAHQQHGFAFVDVLQACPTYNHFATHEYLLERCYDCNAEGHDPSDAAKARQLATADTSKRIACGILYQRTDLPHFYDRLVPRKDKKTTPAEEVEIVDTGKWLKRFT
ncbi:MAG: 2-oxoglutarate ferredoxin oxidoreductase subunit beta [Candidatus Peregrinibacteria bacterium Gr01-1014_25]|nr:MAG: 2-oxoglutarate ferredoxin oxidoreductase subunit beta [Candidatus Peregrinibacteria bacterium Gr01-1014_25]